MNSSMIIKHEIAGEMRELNFGRKCFDAFYQKLGLTPESAKVMCRPGMGLKTTKTLILCAVNAANEINGKRPVEEEEVMDWMQNDMPGIVGALLGVLSSATRFVKQFENKN